MMVAKPKFILRLLLPALLLLFFCEYIIYYLVLIQCGWPVLQPANEEANIGVGDGEEVRVMLLADTHLLGSKKGHWFDKLRREWQMHRAFQTAITLHRPQIVFVLGDVFDEGLWCSDAEFNAYVQRFHSLFHVPTGTQMHVVVGNHDIGFHYGISPYLQERFAQAFDAPSVRLLTVGGSHFVLVNSMAMEGDGCFLCRPAELQVNKIASFSTSTVRINVLTYHHPPITTLLTVGGSHFVLVNSMAMEGDGCFLCRPAELQVNKIASRLQCARGVGKCRKGMALKQYSRPILLQHFPMYRESDAECNEPDEAPEDEKANKFKERWDCLSQESSEMLLDSLNPRVILTGHTHHGCHVEHRENKAHEFTIPSFSWRNKDNPSFVLAVFSPNNYAISKCYMPRESTVIKLYLLGVPLVLLYALLSYRRHCRRPRFFKTH